MKKSFIILSYLNPGKAKKQLLQSQQILLNECCKKCGATEGRLGIGKAPNSASLSCASCHKWVKWLTKSELAALLKGGER